MSTYQSPLSVIIKGAIAGAAGTAVMSAFTERAPEVIERMGVPMPEPQTPPRDRDAPGTSTKKAAERAGEATDAPLTGEQRRTAAEAIHWGYGAAWGAAYGVIQSSFKPPHLFHGTFFGLLVYGVAASIVPRLGLARPPTEAPPQLNAMQVVTHLVYGWSTAVVYAILNLGRRG
jgi:uncharacterized membrane protein YagU involved in acid resistance